MVVRRDIGDAKAQGHTVKKRRFGQDHTLLAKILGDMKLDLVAARDHGLGGEQRLVGASVGVGAQRLDQAPAFAVNDGKINAHAGGGAARRGVQYVCGESSHRVRCPV